jgi:hypothetical protein
VKYDYPTSRPPLPRICTCGTKLQASSAAGVAMRYQHLYCPSCKTTIVFDGISGETTVSKLVTEKK